MKRLTGHKWLIGVAVLVLVFAVGAVAWAATGDSTTTTTTPAVGALGGGLGKCWGGDGQFRKNVQERRAAMQARRDAVLKLVREKMTPEDQKKLDQLVAQVKSQQEALQKARQALVNTAKELNNLVNKYLGVTTPTTATTQSTGT